MSHGTPGQEGGAPRPALPRGAKSLLVAATGGHLAQLVILSELLDVAAGSHWVTFANPQSQSLMAGRDHTFIPYIGPRQVGPALRSVSTIARLLRSGRYDAVISTGAAVAVPALSVAAALGVPAYYVESVSRVTGPSLSGRILRAVPRVRTFTQHPPWARGGWSYDLSVFDAFVPEGAAGRGAEAVPVQEQPPTPLKVFVSLGTIRPYRFDALVDAVVGVTRRVPAQVVWQLGTTQRADLPGTAHLEMAVADFEAAAREADVVVTHAGVGTCLGLVQMGIRPVVVPRRKARREHVDDHQEQIAAELVTRDLCSSVEAPELTEEALLDAARRQRAGRMAPVDES